MMMCFPRNDVINDIEYDRIISVKMKAHIGRVNISVCYGHDIFLVSVSSMFGPDNEI